MTHVEQVTLRLKEMQGLGDVISHNLATRINYDKDIGYALSSASQTVTVGSAVKALIITTLCFV